MTWQGTKVLVTGAGGFIGSHLAEALVRQGADVTALVHYNALGSWGWLDKSTLKNDMRVVAGCITDRDSVQQAMQGQEVVFHLAALIAIPYSYQAPSSYVRTNIEGTLNVMNSARALETRVVVHTSTSEVYGTAQYVPIDERHPLKGQSPYSASKIGADKMAEAYHLSFGVPLVTVRPFNTYGPRQSARAVIPTIITQCLKGARVELGSLTPRRDFNFVANTVQGFLLAATTPGAIGETLNLGTGKDISIGELAQRIGEMVGHPLNINTDELRLRPEGSEVERLLADSQRAQAILGWKPQISLSEGLRQTIDWLREHQDVYRETVYNV